MVRRKLLHAGLAVSLMLTFLAAAGIYHKTSRQPGRKMASRLISELINGITFSETVLLPSIYMILPMVLGIFAAAAFAGEFQKGHLRAVAIRPISRWQIFIGKFISLSVYSFHLFLFAACYYDGGQLWSRVFYVRSFRRCHRFWTRFFGERSQSLYFARVRRLATTVPLLFFRWIFAYIADSHVHDVFGYI